MQYFPTSEVITVENWPYGFRLKCDMKLSIEFHKTKGFRSVTQSSNPKGGWNKPKKSTYSPCLVWAFDGDKHTTSGLSFYKIEELASQCIWLHQYSHLFTHEQIEWLFGEIIVFIRSTAESYVRFCGSKIEDVKPLISPALKAAMLGYKTGYVEQFLKVLVDVDALEATKVPDFQPFTITYR